MIMKRLLRLRDGVDDRGSLALTMLLMIIGVGMTGLMASTVLTQITTTRYDIGRSLAMDAAQSGIDSALGQMRSLPVDSSGDAALTSLPCAAVTAGPDLTLAGSLSTGSTASYTVNVYYLTSAPPPDVEPETWARSNRLGCAAGGGPSTVPMFALLASTGTATTSKRTLVATYLFQSRTKANVPGGTIKVYNSTQCMAAPQAVTDPIPLAVGAPLGLAACASTDPRQIFTYQPTLQVELNGSEATTNFPNGACLSAASIDHTQVTFQNCDYTKLTQIWSLNNRDNFEGTTDGVNTDGKCFNVSWATIPPTVVINNVLSNNPNKVTGTQGDGTDGTPCSGLSGDYTNYKTFFPDPTAGTGAAGDATRQLVNYDEFGRCLDVTSNNVNSSFLVVFPCKQSPNKVIQWNQVWFLPTVATGSTTAQGRIYLKGSDGVTTYCLYSPGSTAIGQYVRITLCTLSSAIPANQLWTRRIFTGINQTSYRIESAYATTSPTPYCLMPSPTDYWNQFTSMKISKLVLGTCDGTNLQKWNASPSILSSVVSDYREK
jgi:hypothetical protein